MDPNPPPDPAPGLGALRRLVTVLMVVMILGMIAIVGLMAWRLGVPQEPLLPDAVSLPGGVKALAVTAARDWYAVVTDDGRILIFDAATGRLRQEVAVTPRAE